MVAKMVVKGATTFGATTFGGGLNKVHRFFHVVDDRLDRIQNLITIEDHLGTLLEDDRDGSGSNLPSDGGHIDLFRKSGNYGGNFLKDHGYNLCFSL